MARATTGESGTVLQSWVSPTFAREIKDLADRDGRTVSNLIRVALRDRLQDETSPIGDGAVHGRASGTPSPARGTGASTRKD